MGMWNVGRLFLAGALVAVTLRAEPPPAAETTTELSTSQSGRRGRIVGGVELRPSHLGSVGAFHTENWAQLGYRFASGTQLVYRQEFNTNLYDPRLSDEKSGMNAYAYDGSFRLKTPDLWKDRGGRSLGYEARVYLPTFAVRRDAGMVTQLRNYFRLRQRLSSAIVVGVEEVPIFHVYARPGVVRSGGRAEANPFFENRVGLLVEVTPFPKVKLFVPLYFSSVRHRYYARGARNDDTWSHKVWLHPELTYELSPQATIGIAYYTENLVRADFSAVDLSSGFSKGVTQFILSASL